MVSKGKYILNSDILENVFVVAILNFEYVLSWRDMTVSTCITCDYITTLNQMKTFVVGIVW